MLTNVRLEKWRSFDCRSLNVAEGWWRKDKAGKVNSLSRYDVPYKQTIGNNNSPTWCKYVLSIVARVHSLDKSIKIFFLVLHINTKKATAPLFSEMVENQDKSDIQVNVLCSFRKYIRKWAISIVESERIHIHIPHFLLD